MDILHGYTPTHGPSLAKRLKPLERAPTDGLLLHEIFTSIQGESTYAGLPCTFVRTTACHLRCSYCDTRHAFAEGAPRSLDDIVADVQARGVPLVLITGGEPLLQANANVLMTRLADLGFTVMLETSGAVDVQHVDARVVKIVDLKTPSSGEMHANVMGNLEFLSARDEIKFVLGNRADYEWAKDLLHTQPLSRFGGTVLMGPVFETLHPRDLATWILQDRLSVRMQLQLHKFIWDPQTRGV